MKILIVVQSLPPAGGAEQVAYMLAKSLSNKHNVHILTFRRDYVSLDLTNIKIHYLPKVTHTLRYYLTIGKKLVYKIVDNIDPDIIHAHMPSILAYILRNNKAKTILTLHNSKFEYYHISLIKKIKFKMFYTNTVKNFDIVTTVSLHMQEYFENIFKRKITFVPNGIVLDNFFLKPNFYRAHKSILYVGRLIESKGVDKICNLAKIMPDYKFTIIGEGHLKDYVSLPNVHFLGKVQNNLLYEFYNKNEFSLFLSTYENFPLVGIEAMACGVIVIATNLGFSEYIIDGVNGFLLYNTSLETVKQKIQRINNKTLIRKNALATVKKFSWNETLDKYIKMYRK